MAQIDALINSMVQSHVQRALIVNDKPMHLYMEGGQEKAGPAIPGAQLQQVVSEITPDGMKGQLGQDGGFQFPYQSPHGAFEIGVGRSNGSLQVTITAAGSATTSATAASGSQNGHSSAPEPPQADAPPVAAPAAPATSPATPGGGKRVPHIDELFHLMNDMEASDLHLSSDEYPMVRQHGMMKQLTQYEISSPQYLKQLLWAIAPERNKEEWESDRDSDFAYEVPGLARFRCNYFEDRKGIGAVFRLIPSKVLTAQQLNLKQSILDLCFLSKGLVVVTGPTGSGKSTTLAAMIDFINKNRDEHIITIEDPVEFVHNNIKCLINQREVHVHTESFKRALRAALREDPDIVLVGEMRDLETIAIAIETAETGHLVFGTLHTTTAPSTVDRIIDQFPADQQEQIRVMLSESLKGVIAQTLLRTTDGKRVAANEILLIPPAVSNLIREGKTFQLPSQMQIGKKMGMVTMNDAIMEFVKAGRVSAHEGYVKSTSKAELLDSYRANDIEYEPGEGDKTAH
ncbi:MAG TPA: type IV pilus twitching motility protein PilT [Abditibacteriaceae bacterium]|jgi:twitching motility protein PilT